MTQTKEGKAAYNKQYRIDNKEKLAAQAKQRYRKKSKETIARQKVYHQKNVHLWLTFIHADKMKCTVCGYNRCWAALDFHHNDSTQKEFNVSSFIDSRAFNKKNQKILLAELSKCLCLCATCHREFHDLQRKLKQDEAERSKENSK